MTTERRQQLCEWADPEKWPNWNTVMYHCNVSVSESLDLMRSIKTARMFEHVRRGVEAYTGMVVRQAVNESGRFYMLVPDMAKRCPVAAYAKYVTPPDVKEQED